MKKIYGNVVMLTGASSGIGKACAEFLSKNGYKVYGTSRKAAEPNSCEVASSSDNAGFIKMIHLDVCSEESVREAVDYVYRCEGHIDILINNAGFGIAGSVEDTSCEEAYDQFNTNFFGMHRMCRAVIPLMRKQGHGLIINLSSVAGVIPIPFQSMYSASKYAIESVTEALRMELKPFGIKVSMVEPGDTRTGFTDQRIYVKDSANSVYKNNFMKSVTSMEKSERNGSGPQVVVKEIARIINSKNPPVRATAGFSYKMIVFFRRLFPSSFIEYIVSKIY